MSRGPWKCTAVADRAPGRPRQTPTPAARFAPIRLTDAPSFAAVFELAFPDGLTLRVARDADPAPAERASHPLRFRIMFHPPWKERRRKRRVRRRPHTMKIPDGNRLSWQALYQYRRRHCPALHWQETYAGRPTRARTERPLP